MAKYLLLNSVILPDFSTYSWSSSLGEGQIVAATFTSFSLMPYIDVLNGSKYASGLIKVLHLSMTLCVAVQLRAQEATVSCNS